MPIFTMENLKWDSLPDVALINIFELMDRNRDLDLSSYLSVSSVNLHWKALAQHISRVPLRGPAGNLCNTASQWDLVLDRFSQLRSWDLRWMSVDQSQLIGEKMARGCFSNARKLRLTGSAGLEPEYFGCIHKYAQWLETLEFSCVELLGAPDVWDECLAYIVQGCAKLCSLALCDWQLSSNVLDEIGRHTTIRKLILRNASNVTVADVLRSLKAGSSSIATLDVVGVPFGHMDEDSERLCTGIQHLSIGCASEKSEELLVRLLQCFPALCSVTIWYINQDAEGPFTAWAKKSTANICMMTSMEK